MLSVCVDCYHAPGSWEVEQKVVEPGFERAALSQISGVPEHGAFRARRQPLEDPLRIRVTAVIDDHKVTKALTREGFDGFQERDARVECGD